MADGYKSKNISETGIVHTGKGKIKGVIVNSHSSGTLKLNDGLEAGVQASSVLTSAGAVTVAYHGQNELTSSGAMVAGTHAVSVMTGNAIVAGNTVTIGTTVYTFRAGDRIVGGGAPYDVALGASLTIALANLRKAINGTGTAGVEYGIGTIAHTQVVCTASDATTITVYGRVAGTSLNTVATTGTATRISWADTTLGGGTGASDAGVTTAGAVVALGGITYTVVDVLSETLGATAVPYEVLKGVSEATMLDNLKSAINATTGAGTVYGTGTVANPYFVATTNTDTVQTVRARLVGDTTFTTAINLLAFTEGMANTAWADSTMGGATGNANPSVTTGASTFTIGTRTYTAVLELDETLTGVAVVDQVLWVTSEAVFLDNIKKAINQTGVAGTDYSTGTTQNTDVTATTNTNTEQTIVARDAGTYGNSIATTETMGNYSWTSTVMASGTGTRSRPIGGTITFSAVATTGERFIPFYNAEVYTGIYATIGGTADLTIVYDDK